MSESIKLTETFNGKPAEVYDAWLDSKKHSDMTGGIAVCSNKVNGEFSAWDGYITGSNIELTENKVIIQYWRTSEFDDNDNDSILSIEFKKVENGTEITLIHNNIPKGQTQYKEGWEQHYFSPMRNYFNNQKQSS